MVIPTPIIMNPMNPVKLSIAMGWGLLGSVIALISPQLTLALGLNVIASGYLILLLPKIKGG